MCEETNNSSCALNNEHVQSIKPIKIETVHKICSGQVVLSLAVAVKELVENSLDAGATKIDVRFKNYGVDLIEVSDNGSGVTEDNFTALTLKYHTSKINDYSDLLGVSSFGFRGEALSSLCELSDLVITTRHKSSQYAFKIEYDRKGNIIKKTPYSRQIGTTVSLSNLFSSLPVRQKEFHKNVKREFAKMTQLLYAYCLISIGVKITCSNQTSNNAKLVVVATEGSMSYKDNIANVFGIKQLQSILEVKTDYMPNIKDNIIRGLSGDVIESDDTVNLEDLEIDLSEDSNDAQSMDGDKNKKGKEKFLGYKNTKDPVELVGYISSCEHNCGRSSSDRQFYYINSRPCEPDKVMKLVNEIYKQFNCNQYPFVFMNIMLDRMSVDINVTPDKRKIFLTKEKTILDVIKCSLFKLFETIPRTLKVESVHDLGTKKIENINPEVTQPRVFNAFMKQFAKNLDKGDYNKSLNNKNIDLKRKSTSMLDFISSNKTSKQNCGEAKMSDPVTIIKPEIADADTHASNNLQTNDSRNYMNEDCSSMPNIENKKTMESKNDTNNVLSNDTNNISENKINNVLYLESTDNLPETQIRSLNEVILAKSHTITSKPKSAPSYEHKIAKHMKTDLEDLGKHNRKIVTLKTSMEEIKMLSNIYQKQESTNRPERVKFKGIINPVYNKNCEEELSREISKADFKDMIVLGQFNLGFIITRLGDDLFIIDQHASDEIYNFETLQNETSLTTQKLVVPQKLELTGINEQILMDNLEIFQKNGFTFECNEQAPPTKRVKLLTIPMSKNWIFGLDDIEELLFMLRASPAENCRPSRIRTMFASRACRKSVMIGTALSNSDMKKLVDHMAEIDKPWNCPHGRPTIRHLVNLAMVHTEET